jgi:hypothetical protein
VARVLLNLEGLFKLIDLFLKTRKLFDLKIIESAPIITFPKHLLLSF